MSQIKFQVRDSNGNVGYPSNDLRGAVLEAAGHDGWGAAFQRDESGAMRLYSSRSHLGNNPYFPAEDDAFQASSDLIDDDAAEADVAEQIRSKGVLHSRYRELEIVELTFEGDVLTHIDGRTPEEIIAQDFDGDEDTTVEMIRGLYA